MKKLLFITYLWIQSISVLFGQNDTSDIYIMHLNDLHAKINHFASLKHVVDSIRSCHKNALLVSAGDLFSGNPYVDKFERPGCPIIKLMKKMHFDVTAVGNHEFDYGQDVLAQRIKQASFPFICANIVTRKTVIPQPAPFVILKSGDLSIAFVSLLQISKNGLPESHPDKLKNLSFSNPFKTIKKFKFLKKKTDVCIALTHLGIKQDKILAEENPWLDAIIGGHSHTRIDTPIIVNGVPITQAGHYVRDLGLMHIRYVNHKIVSFHDQLIPLRNQIKDSSFVEEVKEISKNPKFHEIIADLPYAMDNEQDLGEMMANAYKEELNADISFQNSGGVRIKSFPEGHLKIINVYLLDPFDNEIMLVDMTYNDILSFLRYAYLLRHEKNQWTAGLKAKYITNEKGELVDIQLLDEKGKQLNKTKIYKTAINSYMARSYKFSAKDKLVRTHKYSNDLIIDYLKKHFPVSKKNEE